nr:hypothetical protein BaRGS_024150 [Batillaria attramentaria]
MAARDLKGDKHTSLARSSITTGQTIVDYKPGAVYADQADIKLGDRLQSTFENLHFKVEVHDNKTDTELLRLVAETARKDHSMYDCFVCCILSHGNLGVVYGANGVAVAIRDLTSQLRAQLCPSLRGKPKLFFLQACQGLAEQAGYDCRDTESDAVEEEEVQKIPDESDFLLGYSTIPGFVSYRNRQTGSYYIRKLTETLDECAEDHDIHEILTMVNYSVGKDDISTVRGTRKQTPAPMYTLRKKLIFKRSQ